MAVEVPAYAVTLLRAAIASGAFVGAPVMGFALARELGYRRMHDTIALGIPLGVAALSVPLTLSAVLGAYHPTWVGVLGWFGAVVAVGCFARHGRRELDGRSFLLVRYLWAFALFVPAAVLYFGFPTESPLGGRDEGLFSLAALALARSGTLVLPSPDGLHLAPALFEPFFQGLEFHLPGIPAASVLKPQFSPLLPAWIAQLHAVGGDTLLYRVNALFALGGLVVFHRLACRVMRPAYALVCATVFAFEPAQVWIARINLSEPLGALLALGGMLLAADAQNSRHRGRNVAAAALFACACFVRLDLVIVAPLLFASAVVVMLFGRRSDPGWPIRLAVATLAGQTLAVIALAAWSPGYVESHLAAPLAASALSAILGLAWLTLRERDPGGLRDPPLRRRIGVACAAAVCVAFAYAAFVRPHVGPFATIPGQSALAGLRDYREESLRNLAAYLGWPTLMLGLAGACIAIVRAAAGKGHPVVTMLAVVGIGTCFVFVAAPEVSPDHFWAIRRFVTLAIPLWLLLAGFGAQAAGMAIVGWRAGRAMPVLAVAVAASLLWMQRATLLVRDNAGLTAQLRALDARLPRGRLVIRDFDALATTFTLGFGRIVLPLRDEHVAVDAAAQSFWRSCADTPCTLLHASWSGLGGLRQGPTERAVLHRRYIVPTYVPLPTNIATEDIEVLVTPVAGLASGMPPRNAGAARDWRLTERGFHRDEPSERGDARWTDGDAQLELPSWRADAIELRLASSGGPRDLRIGLDGRLIFEGNIEPGEHTLTSVLPSSAPAPRLLSLESSVFVPHAHRTSGDTRSLGVSIRAVRLIDDTVPAMTPTAPRDAFRSAIDVDGGIEALQRRLSRSGALASVDVRVENRGTATWPSIVETGPATPHVSVGIVWTRAATRERVLEQRAELPYGLRPGEQVRIRVPVDVKAAHAAGLRDGPCVVSIGLVYEGVTWFADRGERTLQFPVEVYP